MDYYEMRLKALELTLSNVDVAREIYGGEPNPEVTFADCIIKCADIYYKFMVGVYAINTNPGTGDSTTDSITADIPKINEDQKEDKNDIIDDVLKSFSRLSAMGFIGPMAGSILNDLHSSEQPVKESLPPNIKEKEEWNPFDPILLTNISDLKLFKGLIKRLEKSGIFYLGDLVQETKESLKNIPFWGPTKTKRIIDLLSSRNLELGMSVPGWTPANIKKMLKMIQKKTRKKQ